MHPLFKDAGFERRPGKRSVAGSMEETDPWNMDRLGDQYRPGGQCFPMLPEILHVERDGWKGDSIQYTGF